MKPRKNAIKAALAVALISLFGAPLAGLLMIPYAPPTVASFEPAQTGPMGWAGEESAAEARAALAEEAPPELSIAGADAQDTANRVVVLWHVAKRMEVRDRAGNVVKPRGRHLPNIAQQIGDCVSWGYRNGINYSLAAAIAFGDGDGEFHQAFAPYIYGISRVQIGGGRLGGDGSNGVWAAKGIEGFGVLHEHETNVPAYSGKLARTWGARPGPPAEFQAIAKQYRAETRLVTTWDQATQAISNGWAVPVCSGVGFQRIVEENGRIEGRRSGSWAHCMCFIGYDSRPGREALYCLNSWGPNAHARESRYAELDGAPPGGFWVLKADAERMLRAGDSYAISFNGFRPRPKSIGALNASDPKPSRSARTTAPDDRGASLRAVKGACLARTELPSLGRAMHQGETRMGSTRRRVDRRGTEDCRFPEFQLAA